MRGSGANNSSRTKVIDPVAQQMASPQSPSRSPGGASKFVAQYEKFVSRKADTHVLGNDTEVTQVPAGIPILHLSPEEHAALQNSQRLGKDLVERNHKTGFEEHEGENGKAPGAMAFTSFLESNGEVEGEALATMKRTTDLRGADPCTPKPVRAPIHSSHSQNHDREVKLLVSTLNYDACTRFASRACYCGPPGKWTLFDEYGSEEVSLVTNVSSKMARKAFSYLTGKRIFTLKGKPVCVMYMEPRNGGEVLVRGLFMAKDPLGDGRQHSTLMRKLCGFFGDFDM